MAELLTALVVGVVLVVVVSLVAMAFSLRAIARGNRVSPTASTGAPLHWRVDPSPAGRLHRRLQAVVRQLQMSGVLVPGRRRARASHPLAVELETQAVELDRRLVVVNAAKGKKRKRKELDALALDVERLEVLTLRLVAAAHWQSPLAPGTTTSALDHVAEQLDALEAGQREITELDVALGQIPLPPPPTPASDRSG
jgi:hypothetical protein